MKAFVDGGGIAGRATFEGIETVVRRAVESGRVEDLGFLWYLCSGPTSPLFGKDRITTFERDFIVDKDSHRESKNPHFSLLHNPDFCSSVLSKFDVDSDDGLIVNGHVPVKVEKGESPLNRSGKASPLTVLSPKPRAITATHWHLSLRE